MRSNADGTSTQPGVPLTFTLTVLSSDCSGPVVGATVDIWSANAQGVYSDESSESTSGSTWLRGYQVTDSSGRVTFTTIYPGWYDGRTDHVHVRIRTTAGLNVATQMMFDDAVTARVLATSAYARTRTRGTTNSNDRVYADEAADHGVFAIPLTGSTTAGYTGELTAVIASAASTTGTAGTATPTTTTTTGSLGTTVTAVKVTGLSARRHRVAITLRNAHTVKVDARLYKGASMRYRALSTQAAGVRTVTLTVPAHVHGAHTLALLLSDSAGHTAKATRAVTLG